MNEFFFPKMKISIHYSLLAIVFLMIYTGLYIQILSFFLCIIAHESAHILTSKVYHIKTTKLTITAIGGIANINLNNIKSYQKIIILSSGIIVNAVLFFIIKDEVVKTYNYLLIIFNLIPVYPLDGYRIFEVIIDRKMPLKWEVLLLRAISFLSCLLVIIYGFVLKSYGLIIIAIFLVIKGYCYFFSDIFILKKVTDKL